MEQLDLEFYSREVFALGKEAMEKLAELKVLVTGMSALGSQVAKLLVLSGVKSVFIHDDRRVTAEDAASLDLLRGVEITRETTRAHAVQPCLQRYNRRVAVTVVEGDLLSLNLKEYDLLVATDKDLITLTKLSNLCREKSKHIGLVICECWGLMGSVFVDFNNEFLVYDKDGLEPESYMITNISQECPGIVTIEDERPLKLADGDWVTFKGVHGMMEVTLPEPRPIKYRSVNSFSIEDTRAYSAYVSGGIVTQFKMPEMVTFSSFQQSLLTPAFDEGLFRPDVLKADRVGQLHFVFHALMEYRKKHGALPSPENANECYDICVKLNSEAKGEHHFSVEAINRDIVTRVVSFAKTTFRPVISVIAGVTALEVLKFTGKFRPIRQWFHYDCLDTAAGQDQPIGQRLKDLNLVLVGAGAVGCKLLSLLQTMDITGGRGSITVIDDGVVTYPLLCTHSLFTEEDVGRRKAEVAAATLTRRSPTATVTGLPCSVEDPQLSDEFWERADLIICAADRDEAIRSTETKAIWYEKPSLFVQASGTQGSISNHLPQKTGSLEFLAANDTKVDSASIDSYPCRAGMCVEWAIRQFHHLFLDLPKSALMYLDNPQKFVTAACNDTLPSARLATFELLKDFFEVAVTTDPAASVLFARRQFEQCFYIGVQKLLEEHPLDQETDDGKMFWSGKRLPPEPLSFTANEELHFNYIATCADLISRAVGRTLGLNKLEVKKIANQSLRHRIEGEMKTTSKFDELQVSIDALCGKVDRGSIRPIPYEKDDPSGTQLEFIVSSAHLRCSNYKIEAMERLKIKQIAGGLKPSLPAMGAFLAGLSVTELLKLAANVDVDQLKEVRANLATPELMLTETRPLRQMKPSHSIFEENEVLIPPKFTVWEKIAVAGPMTLQQFREYIERTYSIHILIIYSHSVVLFNVVNASNDAQTDMKTLYETKTQTSLPAGSKYLHLHIEARTQAEDRNAIVPVIKYAF